MSSSPPSPEVREVRIQAVRYEADGILSYELRSPQGRPLPAFTAGAHIDLHLANGLVRSYSLLNPQHETHRYVVAVQRDPASRGGSAHVHQHLRTGDVLRIGAPRNNFKLHEEAAASVFIAGGIGITPFVGMAQRMQALGRDWQLHYFVRSADKAAFVEQLKEWADAAAPRVVLHVIADGAEAARQMGLLVARAPASAHLYCCGPSAMIQGFLSLVANRPAGQVHVEHFSAAGGTEPGASSGGFKVYLAGLQREIEVPANKSILSTLLDAGIDVPYSCEEGVCGACETRVLEGTPDHRDLILGDKEKAAGKTMMICCSRSKSERLVLEI